MKNKLWGIVLCIIFVMLSGCTKKDLSALEIYQVLSKNKNPMIGCMVDIKDEDSLYSSGVAFSVGSNHVSSCTKNLDDFDARILVFDKSDDAQIYFDVVNSERDYANKVLVDTYGFSEEYVNKEIDFDTFLDHYSIGINKNVVVILNNKLIGENRDLLTQNLNKAFDSYKQSDTENYTLNDFGKKRDEFAAEYYEQSKLPDLFESEFEELNMSLDDALLKCNEEINQENHIQLYNDMMSGKRTAENVRSSPGFSEKADQVITLVDSRLTEFQPIHDNNVTTINQMIGNAERTLNYDTFMEASSLVNQYSSCGLYSSEKTNWNSRLSAIRTAVNDKKQFDDYASACVSVTYDDLMRYSGQYENTKIVVTVYVTEVEADGIIFEGTIWASLNGKTCTVKDNRTVKEPKILSGDTITIYGTGGGLGTVRRYVKGSGVLGSDLFAKTVEEYQAPAINATYVIFK